SAGLGPCTWTWRPTSASPPRSSSRTRPAIAPGSTVASVISRSVPGVVRRAVAEGTNARIATMSHSPAHPAHARGSTRRSSRSPARAATVAWRFLPGLGSLWRFRLPTVPTIRCTAAERPQRPGGRVGGHPVDAEVAAEGQIHRVVDRPAIGAHPPGPPVLDEPRPRAQRPDTRPHELRPDPFGGPRLEHVPALAQLHHGDPGRDPAEPAHGEDREAHHDGA